MEWISVEDRLPTIGDKILTASPARVHIGYVATVGCEDSADYFEVRSNSSHSAISLYNDTNDITHWMPLPSPPKSV